MQYEKIKVELVTVLVGHPVQCTYIQPIVTSSYLLPFWLKIGSIRIQSKDTDLIYQELQGNNPYQLEHGRL